MLKLPTIFFLVAFSVLAVIHVLAMKLFLYWSVWWFDIPMHFLGGSVVALGLFTLHDLRIIVQDRHLQLVQVITLVLLIALSWEVFELAVATPVIGDYMLDTFTDLGMGILGGLVGYSIGFNLKKI